MTRKATFATAAQLAAMGVVGTAGLTVLVTMAATAVSLIFAAGVGLLLVPIVALILWSIAWFEENRIARLYRAQIPPRRMPQSVRTDWLRWPATFLKQFVNGENLRALLSFTIASILGLASLFIWQLALTAGIFAVEGIRGGADTFSEPWFGVSLSQAGAIALGIGVLLLGIGMIYVLTVAHRSVSEQLLVPSREAEFAEQATAASQRRDEAMRAAEVERTRIERDLHDGVQPRLVSVGMTLGMAKAKLESDPEAAAALIEEAHASTKEAITELRQLARGIHPAVLEDRGLDAALSAVAARSHIPVELNVQLAGRCSKESEAAMYFAVSEALTNAAKHSGARQCRVTIMPRPGGLLWARIEDDGHGGAHRVPGGGIDGVANRVAAAGGFMYVVSPAGGPTSIEVSIPCAF